MLLELAGRFAASGLIDYAAGMLQPLTHHSLAAPSFPL
jgi:hypothetical protein